MTTTNAAIKSLSWDECKNPGDICSPLLSLSGGTAFIVFATNLSSSAEGAARRAETLCVDSWWS
jgi:hypothetical protein